MQSAPEVLVYSIDESFLDLTTLQKNYNLEQYASDLVKKIYRQIGIPVSIGISSTKTLAKVANHIVKKEKPSSHALYLKNNDNINKILSTISTGKIWGIGRQWDKALHRLGIINALSLKQSDPNFIKAKFNIVLARTICELNHLSCIELDNLDIQKKTIIVSKSFGERQTELPAIQEALSHYIDTAARKLRKQQSVTQQVCVFLQTNLASETDLPYKNSASTPLPYPTADTRLITKFAIRALKDIYVPGFRYKKVGVYLSALQSSSQLQLDIFNQATVEKSEQLMDIYDKINQTCGKGSIQFAATGFDRQWRMKQMHLSDHSLTNWQHLPLVRC